MRTKILFIILFIIFNACEKDNKEDPIVKTRNIEDKTETSITCGGSISNHYKADVDSYGVCWSTTDTLPTINDNLLFGANLSVWFSIELSGLQPYTRYYIRAFAQNKRGTFYGNTLNFWTQPLDGTQIEDVESNIYHTVKIGTQVWIVENLKTKRFRNGDLISYMDPQNNDSSAYCYYDHDINRYNTYGCLYNFNAIQDERKISPEGWHLPVEEEWKTLIDSLGGCWDATAKLKEAGSTHWEEENNGTNESGFTALPGGEYDFTFKRFDEIGSNGSWWSYEGAFVLSISSNNDAGYSSFFDGDFYSVRCIQD